MAMPQKQIYTEIDYYALPEDVRAELIDGLFKTKSKSIFMMIYGLTSRKSTDSE